jgi:hypothetical protein
VRIAKEEIQQKKNQEFLCRLGGYPSASVKGRAGAFYF